HLFGPYLKITTIRELFHLGFESSQIRRFLFENNVRCSGRGEVGVQNARILPPALATIAANFCSSPSTSPVFPGSTWHAKRDTYVLCSDPSFFRAIKRSS